jgi:hypothetical protein
MFNRKCAYRVSFIYLDYRSMQRDSTFLTDVNQLQSNKAGNTQ